MCMTSGEFSNSHAQLRITHMTSDICQINTAKTSSNHEYDPDTCILETLRMIFFSIMSASMAWLWLSFHINSNG